ncbi:MAG: haloacid dehalogenase type II [Phycisphaerales bacterium]|nr:haloacid dehalogenase type II [Phycisphaerales bacterium]
MNQNSITHLTFDCYGTLIDWETGILRAIRPVLSVHGIRTTDDELLELYAPIEARIEAGDYQPYRQVLREAMQAVGEHFKLQLEEKELDRLPNSLASWPAFPDTAPALARLSEELSLNILSNIDEDLFEGSRPRLEAAGARIDRLISAQLCRSYKPSHRNFNVALALLDIPKDRILHIAQSLYHDIKPARELGLQTVWINRRHNKPGAGATPRTDPSIRPDIELPDMKSLADLLCSAR